jgi:hypothetical protein
MMEVGGEFGFPIPKNPELRMGPTGDLPHVNCGVNEFVVCAPNPHAFLLIAVN